MSRLVSGVALGGGISMGYAAVGGTAQQRVGVPTGLGLALMVLLPAERDLGLGVILGSLGVSVAVSKAQGRSAIEFLPASVRSEDERIPRRLRSGE